ncbi:glutaredoxin family protein [Candidatus Woesearchaeota archaeon]|nr:glutaredoxin family protein [Candidatus Woesearchaeota archaeon]
MAIKSDPKGKSSSGKKPAGSKVKVYSTESCPWCHKAKEFLAELNVPYQEIDVSRDENGRNEMIEKSGQLGVPVLDVNGTIIVGFDQEAIENALHKKTPSELHQAA